MSVGDRRSMCMVALVPNILRATVIDLEVALVPISKIRRLLNDVSFSDRDTNGCVKNMIVATLIIMGMSADVLDEHSACTVGGQHGKSDDDVCNDGGGAHCPSWSDAHGDDDD